MRKLKVGQFILWDMGGVNEHHPLPYALRGGPRDVAVVNQDGRVLGMLWRHEVMQALNGGASRYRTVRELMDAGPRSRCGRHGLRSPAADGGPGAGRGGDENGYYRGIFTSSASGTSIVTSRTGWLEMRARLLRFMEALRCRGAALPALYSSRP